MLRNSFPREELMTKRESNGLKAALNNECPTFKKVISDHEPWKKFYNYLNSKKTFILFYNLIKDELDRIEERKNLKKLFFVSGGHAEYSKTLYTRVKKKILGQFYQNVNLSLEFSILSNNCHIPPHSDSKKSILSWMLYFPDENYKKIEPKEIYGLGTDFYIKREEIKENYFNGWEKDKLLSEKDQFYLKIILNFFTSQDLKKILYLDLLKMKSLGMILLLSILIKILKGNRSILILI